MADLFERLSNQPIRTTSPGTLPSVDFAAGREAVRTSATISKAMDRISNFAFERAKKEQTISGTIAGSSDPGGTLAGLQGVDPANFSIEQGAAYNAAVKGLSTEIEVEAKKQMGLEILESSEKGETPQQLEDRLDMVTIGFADALGMMDPGSAQQLTATLTNYRNAQYLSFSEGYIKQQRDKSRAEGAINLETMLQGLEDAARSDVADVDVFIQNEIQTIADYLDGQQFSESEIASEVLKARKRANIARARGGFERQETVEDKLKYAQAFEDSIAKKGGMARGLSDATASTLANSFKTLANADRTALNSEIALVKADISSEVSAVVTKGGIPGRDIIKRLNARVTDLEVLGGDKGKIAELKEQITKAEANIDYFKGIQAFNIEQLQNEKTRLESVRDTEATPDDLLRLTVIKSRLSPMISEANAQNATWKTAATAVGKSVDALEKVAKRFDPLKPQDIDAVESSIKNMEDAGAPPEMVDALRAEVAKLQGLSGFYNEIAKDSGATLENRIIALSKQAQETGLSTIESEVLDDMEKRLTSMRTALKTDPLSWGNSSGVVGIEPDVIEKVLLGSDTDEIESAVALRVNHANKIAGHYGTPRKMLTQSEASGLATALNEAPLEAQAGLLKRVVEGFGSNSLTVLQQVHKDAPELAHIGGLMATGAPDDVIMSALKGRVIKAGKEDRAMGELSDQRDTRMTVLQGLSESPNMIKTVDRLKTVADLIYLGRGGSQGGAFNNTMYEQALQEASGMRMIDGEAYGGIVLYKPSAFAQGKNIILPQNIRQDDGVDEIFDNMTTIDDFISLAVVRDDLGNLKDYDQAPVGTANGVQISLDILKDSYLVSVGDGLYKIGYGNQIHFTPQGLPYLIDLKKVQQ